MEMSLFQQERSIAARHFPLKCLKSLPHLPIVQNLWSVALLKILGFLQLSLYGLNSSVFKQMTFT